MRIERVDGDDAPAIPLRPALEARLDAVVDLERLARLLHLPRRRRPPHNRRPLGLDVVVVVVVVALQAARRAPAAASASRSASVRYAPPLRAVQAALRYLTSWGSTSASWFARVVLAGAVVAAGESPVRRCRSNLAPDLAAAEAGALEPAADPMYRSGRDRRQQIRADLDPPDAADATCGSAGTAAGDGGCMTAGGGDSAGKAPTVSCRGLAFSRRGVWVTGGTSGGGNPRRGLIRRNACSAPDSGPGL